jgi:hypothetical protein
MAHLPSPARIIDDKMMRGLAIETSGRMGSLAVSIDGRAVAEEQFPHGHL